MNNNTIHGPLDQSDIMLASLAYHEAGQLLKKTDSLDRLTAGEFYRGTGGNWVHDGSFDEKNLAYDKNGNILSLYRFADSNTFIDEMRYHYLAGTNQIGYITDRQGDIPDVVDYPGNTKEDQTYFYDGNGNLIHDYDKNLYDTIGYNFLNKPEKFDFGNGEKIFYIYDATGLKVARKVVDNNETGETSLRYLGNFIYNWNGDLQYILTTEGRLVPDGGGFRFEYFMKDHLGNTRATYASAAPGVTQVAEYNHYYPFGMELEGLAYSSAADLANDYLYNGKELQREYNLGWYDYGARFYDPQISRFHSIDKLTNRFVQLTPYQYCSNNPISKVEIDGLEGIWFNKVLQYSTAWKRIYEIASNTTSHKTFEKLIKSQVKWNVYYFPFYGAAAYGYVIPIKHSHDYYASKYRIDIGNKIKLNQKGTGLLFLNLNDKEIDPLFANGKGVIFIGINENQLKYNDKTELSNSAATVLHEEISHGVNVLENKNTTASEDHDQYYGCSTGYLSPSDAEVRNDQKYENSQARKDINETDQNANKEETENEKTKKE